MRYRINITGWPKDNLKVTKEEFETESWKLWYDASPHHIYPHMKGGKHICSFEEENWKVNKKLEVN